MESDSHVYTNIDYEMNYFKFLIIQIDFYNLVLVHDSNVRSLNSDFAFELMLRELVTFF